MNLRGNVRRRVPMLLVLTGVLGVAAVLYLSEVNPAASQSPQLLAKEASHDPGLDPSDSAWDSAPPLSVALTGQSAYPAGGGRVRAVEAQALHHGGTLYVRVSWNDSTHDDSAMRTEQFSDAVALEFPATAAVTVPSICMGQADAGVNIWQWRADSQSGSREPADQFPNMWVEQYPADDPEFVTAREAGNPYAIADGGAVQNLVATAFGTIGPAASQDVGGQGVYQAGAWSVVFSRNMEEANPSLVSFHETGSTDMAFAVWDGSNGDRNGQKSVSTFVTLAIVPGDEGTNVTTLALAAGVFAVLAAVGIFVAVYGYKKAD